MATDFLDNLMGYNPSELDIFKEAPASSNRNENIYKTNPKDSVSDSGNYISTVRIVYNPFDIKRSIVHQAVYALTDSNGFFMPKSKLGDGDRDCPIFKAWKKLYYNNANENKKDWIKSKFDKHESNWVLVQILEDANKPELVGQFKVMKLPKAILTKLTGKMNPSEDSKKQPVPIMDYLIGSPLEIEVQPGPNDPKQPERRNREITYDLCDFSTDYAPIIKTDGTPLFDDSELEIIENFVDARTAIIKARSKAKKDDATKQLQSLHEPIKKLYKKALDYVKANAIDLVQECAYTGWDEDMTKRVDNFISKVLKFQDPAAQVITEDDGISTGPIGINDPQAESSASQKIPDAFAEVTSEDAKEDDLPF